MLSDLKLSLRQLAKSPGFTLVSVLSLALGIGASTAIFSVVNAVLLRSLPVPNPHELRELRWTGKDAKVPSQEGTGTVSAPVFLSLREQSASQADLFGLAPLEDVIARGSGEAFPARGMMVSDNFFSGLAVRPFIGRLLEPGTDYAGAGPSVVLSYAAWQKQFALSPTALGRTLTLNGHTYIIVGILPAGFAGVQPGQPSDFYVPLSPNSPFLYVAYTSRFHWFVRLMARLKPDTTDAQLGAALDVAFAREVAEAMQQPHVLIEPGRSGPSADRENYRQPLLLMLGVVGLVMLVACANLAGLSLARGAGRQHELSVRAALGAGRWRLIRQSFAESLVLAGLGGGLGILLAAWGRAGIVQLLAGSADGLRHDLSLDLTVLAFTLGLALLTALLSGVLPALRAGRVDPLHGLKHRGALSAPRLRSGRVLVTAQMGLSLLLLTGAGLYLRTLVNLAHIDAGFNTEKLLLFQLNIRGSGAADARPAEFYTRLQSSLPAIPGVQSATLIDFPLLGGLGSSGSFNAISGRPNPQGTEMQTRRLRVGETFFATVGLPVRQGRAFTAADTETSPKVIVVNEAFVKKHLPDENPLGQTINIWGADWRIVGVCGDAKYNSLKAAVPPTTYFPFQQMFYSRYRTTHLRSPWFAVRTAVAPEAVMAAVRKTVAGLDPAVGILNVTTQDDVRDHAMSRERLLASLCGGLAILAVLLSCIGLYGLMAYHVTRRTSEFGLRLALGAQASDLSRPILREALRLAALGIATGVPAVFALSHLLQSQLYGVQPTDPLTLVAVTLALVAIALVAAWLPALVAIALVAAWLPARRAARIDPLVALRTE